MKSLRKFKQALLFLRGEAVKESYFRFVNVSYIRNLLSATGSFKNGGRYNLKNLFEVLYMSPDSETALKESKLPEKFQLAPHIIISIDVTLQSVLDLDDKNVIQKLGICNKELFINWRYPTTKESYTQTLGRLVYESKNFEAIRYPSTVKRKKYNLAVFPNRLKKSSKIKIYDPDKMIESIIKGH